jgi:hypothetical protein
MTSGSVERNRTPRLPPRWFIRSAWVVHRAIHRFTGGAARARDADARGQVRLSAPEDGRAPLWSRARRHPRLLRRWTRPRHPGYERLGRCRARLVAEPSGASRCHRRAQERLTRGPRSSRGGGRTGAPVGKGARLQRLRRRRRRICHLAVVRDGGRRPGAEAGERALTRVSDHATPGERAAACARAIISLTTAVLASAYCCMYFQSPVANSRFVRV